MRGNGPLGRYLLGRSPIVAGPAIGVVVRAQFLRTAYGIFIRCRVFIQFATSALSTAGIVLISGRVLSGYLLDRSSTRKCAIAFVAEPAIGVALLSASHASYVLVLGLSLYKFAPAHGRQLGFDRDAAGKSALIRNSGGA